MNVNNFPISGMAVLNAAQESREKRRGADEKLNLTVSEVSVIHSAIPFLPLPAAIMCLVFNIFLPGAGTILSGYLVVCIGQTRIHYKEAPRLMSILVNLLVGLSQFFTITFLFVGWFWSLAWGGLLIVNSIQYRDALIQRRQEAIATAALEALTRNSVLHRRDVKTLIRENRKDKNEKNNPQQ
uniref:Protein SPEC3 n=1 Tax=Ascaris lumbricoides TaxID=6252 RepID=A0A0M3IE71_ASCLU